MDKVDTFYVQHGNVVSNYVYSLLKDLDLTQEIIQETFVRVCENKESFEGFDDKEIRGWILRVAHRLCIDYWRKSNKIVFDGMNVLPDIFCEENNIVRQIQTDELRAFMQEMIQKLKIEHQQAIDLVDINHLSYKESACMLGITEEAFGSLLKRARQALNKKILNELDPIILKLPLSPYEQKMLITWFDILDYPNNVEKEISLKAQNFFNGFHQTFESFRKKTYPRGLDHYLMSFVQLNSKTIAADFGCGTGSLIKEISPFVSEIYAIDNSKEMLNSLNDSLRKNNLTNAKIFCADVSKDLSFMKETVEVGFCCMLLHHVFNPSNALKQMAKALVSGGHLVIADLTYTNQNWMFKESHDFWSGFKMEQIQKWIKESGFEIIDLKVNEGYKFQFLDLKEKGECVEVPLLTAYCKKC